MPTVITHISKGTNPQQILMIGELAQAYASAHAISVLSKFDMSISNDASNKLQAAADAAQLALIQYLEGTQSKEFMANVPVPPAATTSGSATVVPVKP